ncbi:glycosyltransferase [Crocosphaera watsonii WH 8501]|uniref:Glycosyl transferase, family 2 n=7 Tax=Crocosphaera watsonii TaxID=263511 RepID=Q4BWU7_CROWT|nr:MULTISPECIES: glycosyltransferase [Crocosphaera]EAM48378.1 Glycosyl transferase, family 2 [Crocosphaera watsonii WH 8501]EHJ14481.1 Glycosyl transferase, family 2 [Crocosphaera watsonii WH 0003]MCH2243865.1 glycosyltransferase [Crocosphaera sp.]NQZ61453.1 glycosyltransferase [Crocosphaera sp.]CCQ49707.1 Glycosyl transferase, family 2 [Crocosphaera watsonii WH 8502]
MLNILTIIVSLSLVIWIYLLLFRGKFWLSNQRINEQLQPLTQYPSVCAVIPARNEADVLPISLKSLLNQDYPGNLSIILVDDQSDDNTGNVAQEIANNCQKSQQLQVISGQPLAEGWSGKLWAMKQGIEQANKLDNKPDYLLLTDADIEHHDSNLKELVKQAEIEKLAMTSLMVKLRCDSFWEQFLIPAFVFFFEKLYPFSWVNNPKNKMAAAAGGCILIRRQILEEIGGIEVVKQALIDDCSLAAAVKAKLQEDRQNIKQGIWLGLSEKTLSLRPYENLDSIWNMVARTAYTQLNYSPLLLIGTLLGLTIVYLVAPIGLIMGLIIQNTVMTILGGITWLLMSISYLPTLKLYQCSLLWSLTLPLIGLLYGLMTLDSAWRHWRGKGGGWKGRVYVNS